MTTLLAWLGAAALTILIETPILVAAGYRSRVFVVVCILVNLATNLALNLGLSLSGSLYWYALGVAEGAVVIVEWIVLGLVADQGSSIPLRSRGSARLMLFVFLANLASFLVGVLLWFL